MWAAFCFIAVVFYSGVNTQTSHYGREFVFGMIPNFRWYSKIVVDIASETDGRLYYSIPHLNLHRNMTIRKGSTTINIDSKLAAYDNFTEQRGIFMSTNVPVAVFMTSYFDVSVDSYLVLPVSALGSHYRVASYGPDYESNNENAEMLIVAAYNDTNVIIKGNDNKTTSLNMNRLFSHQVSSIKDLSNVEIIASKPVSVISGTVCANVPHRIPSCDMLLEQMVPIESWTGDTFIVPPYHMSKGFLLKILTNSSSNVCLRNSTKTICNTSRYLPEEFLMGTEPVVVTSNGHISVVQYGLSYQYDYIGDPYMTVIPAIDNYLNNYYFVVSARYKSLTNYLSVIVSSSQSNGLLLDGSKPTAIQQYSVPGLNYTVLVVNISVGYHTLKHSDSNVKFGALVYGHSYAKGFGFPLGFQFPGGFPPREQRGPLCFDCNLVRSPDECNTLATCAKGQACKIEEYKELDHSNFKMGCSNGPCSPAFRSVHMALRAVPVCLFCCEDDYCNSNCTLATDGTGSVIVG